VLLALLIYLLVPTVDLPLAERRLWGLFGAAFTIVGVVGLLLLAVDRGERYLQSRVRAGNFGESQALLRLLRRVVQGVLIAAGVVVALEYFGFDPTAALAGLGIGGIAVALAAQKTLENVIGGFSIVFDQAVRVGDFVKVGEVVGTVDHVGLRSTQIRTLGRTVVSLPNGQMATVNIETLSRRDKFWFHHVVGLRYETTVAQMREISARLEDLLMHQPGVDGPSVRVRFIRLGAYSLDIELFAYIWAADWERFLEIQQDLLLRVMEIVESAGTEIAFPSQTVHLAQGRGVP
jgi:MscS family membrane protein